MEDLESGFEEMQGVKLGYLVIKGKQMFALSQVFTDLLKNIPRTTVHKRMDHLNVKKHHCDLEELRKLKAINSIAFHAAKCTLISREDVEALYVSCKTERVLKSNKRKEKTNKSADKTCERKSHAAVKSDFWRQKVWLSLRSVPQTFSFKSKAGQDSISSNHSNLPQIYRKSFIRDFQSDSKAHSTPFKNYETARISGSCVAFNQKHTYIRHVVDRQPLLCQSAIAAHSKHQGNADVVYKRKRKRESCARQFWLDRSSHPVLVVPKCCKPKVTGRSLSQFHHLDHGLYIDAEHFHDCCSSDTESSSISERVNNDSDFGSSFSTTSNSGSSEEEDDSLSDSSDGSTDQESSSQSDSSSVSSLVSVQSIRFRRARFSTLSTKAPLVLQPTFQYRPTQQKNTTKPGETASLHSETAGRTPKFRNVDNAVAEVGTVQKFLPVTFSDLGDKKSCRRDFLQDPKTQHSATNRTKDNDLLINGNRNKAFAQQRNPGSANKCSQDSITHCVPDKEVTVCKSSSSNLISASNSKKEEKTSHKVPSPAKPIKIEVDESVTTSSSITEVSSAAKTQFVLKSVKIKVEDNADEYEYANQACGLNCDDVHANQSRSLKESVYCRSTERSIKHHQEPRRTLPLLDPEESECKNGTRVRKNYRAMLLGKKAESLRTSTRPVAKVDRNPCPVGKYPSNGAGACRRKSARITAKPFSFLANFPSPPSLVIGSDGDLSPAHSLNSVRTDQLPHRSHPVWRWQLGHTVVPPPNHKIMKDCVVSRSLRLSENVLNL